MSEKLTQDIREEVDKIFKQKEEIAMRKQVEEALDKSANKINELVASLQEKEGEISELESKLTELEETVSELSLANKNLKENLDKATSDFEAEKEELIKKAEAAEAELENIKKDQLAQARFDELKNDGVAASTDKAIKDQMAKIREMTDEEFVAYKAERLELRNSVIAELEASSKESTEDDTKPEEASEVVENESDKDDLSDVDGSVNEPMKAMAALLNMEVVPGADLMSKYEELGKEMAKVYVKNVSE